MLRQSLKSWKVYNARNALRGASAMGFCSGKTVMPYRTGYNNTVQAQRGCLWMGTGPEADFGHGWVVRAYNLGAKPSTIGPALHHVNPTM